METTGDADRAAAVLYRALQGLCEGYPGAVSIVRIVNGLEQRLIIRIEASLRPSVYAHLAEHTDIFIPPDGGPLSLSIEQAVRIGELEGDHAEPIPPLYEIEAVAAPARAPRLISADVSGSALESTFG